MEYGLKRRWFSNQPSQIKEWVRACYEDGSANFACVRKITSSFGNGFAVTTSKDGGYSMADILYSYYKYPKNMLYINRISSGKLWFVFASSGVLYSDYLVSLDTLASDSSNTTRNQLIQEIDRFNFLEADSEVVVISDDVIVNGQELIFLSKEVDIDGKELRLVINTALTIQNDVLPDLEEISKSIDIKIFKLIDINSIRFPYDTKIIMYVGVTLLFLLIIFGVKSLNNDKEPKTVNLSLLPPIIIDTFKPLKAILSGEKTLDDEGQYFQEGVAVKQRFFYIIQDLLRIKSLKGWNLKKYQAGRDFSSFIIEQSYGKIENVKETFPSNVFYIEATLNGFQIVRKVPTIAIFNTPVRANYNKEMVWLDNAISWVWPKSKINNAIPIKKDVNQKHIESLSTVTFEKFYIEDFDSLSSIFVGRSAGFVAFEIEGIPGRKAFKGFFNYKIYGVRGEFDGLVKK